MCRLNGDFSFDAAGGTFDLDADVTVRVASAVSLLLLGERDVENQIVTSLKSADQRERITALDQLMRITNGRSLIFARPALQELAKQSRDRSYEESRVQKLLARIK